ncbi:MAG: antibiotic biosynthesis monooxygenase [Planctomycetota bacterium]|nr:antibiotic biosynthesis monooxygenase [Planctomycetota bacterium]
MQRIVLALITIALPLLGSCASTGGTHDVTDTSTRPVTYLLTLEVKDGQLETFKTVMEELVASTRGEPGTLMYEWYISDDETTVQILERFEDTAAYLLHGDGFAPFAERFLATVDIRSFRVFGDPDEAARERLAGLGPAYMGGLGGFRRAGR